MKGPAVYTQANADILTLQERAYAVRGLWGHNWSDSL